MLLSTEQMKKANSNPLYQTIGIRVISAKDGQAISKLKPVENVC